MEYVLPYSCFLEFSKETGLWYKHVGFQRLTQFVLSTSIGLFLVISSYTSYICDPRYHLIYHYLEILKFSLYQLET